MHFYPGDWRKSPEVQALDYEARGVWFETLLMMHESSERGALLLNGRPMTLDEHARVLGLPAICLAQIFERIMASGAASRREDGAIVCRRMVREDELSQVRADAGSEGGKARSRKQNASKTHSKTLANAEDESEVEDEVEDPDLDHKETVGVPSQVVASAAAPEAPDWLEPRFDTPTIRKFLPQVVAKLRRNNRTFAQTEFEANFMQMGCDIGRMERALVHTAALTSPYNLNEPGKFDARGSPPAKLSNADRVRKFVEENSNGSGASFEGDGLDSLGIRGPLRPIAGTPNALDSSARRRALPDGAGGRDSRPVEADRVATPGGRSTRGS